MATGKIYNDTLSRYELYSGDTTDESLGISVTPYTLIAIEGYDYDNAGGKRFELLVHVTPTLSLTINYVIWGAEASPYKVGVMITSSSIAISRPSTVHITKVWGII